MLVALLLAGTPAPARADDPLGVPSIASDRPDYAPGDHVVLTGAGWGVGEDVHVTVTPSDPGVPSPYEGDALAGLDGGFSVEFDLPLMFVADYTVVATGESGAVATTTFTDANAEFDAARVPSSGNLSVPAGSMTPTTFSIGARKTGGGADPVVTGIQFKNNPGNVCSNNRQTAIPSPWLSITSPATPHTLTSATTFTTFTIRVAPPGNAPLGQYTGAIEFTTSAGGSQTFDLCLNVVNAAPAVAADNATVAVNEGLAAANTGTYSDPNGNAVAITASVGTITKTGTSTGTWSWGYPTTDGPANSQTVTITANDGSGGVSTTTFALTVLNVAPTATFSAPASVAEGSAIALSLSAPSDVAADLGSLEYAFDCGSGTFEALSSMSTASCTTTDQGSRTVRGKVRDKDGGETVYSATTAITNVAPTATLGNNGPMNEGSPVTISFSGQSDPSTADTTAGFHYAFSCSNGDLSGSTYAGSGTVSSTMCTFPDDGSFTVKGRIIDKDDGFTEYTTVVTVSNVAPQVTAPADQLANEGSSANFLPGSFADPGADGPWSISVDWGDSSTPTTFTQASPGTIAAQTHTYADDDDYTVTVTVSEAGLSPPSGSTTFEVAVSNVAPTIETLTADSPILEGGSSTVTVGASDPAGANDPLSYEYDCANDGSYEIGPESTGSASCTYTDNGTFTVKVRVTDGDGGAATATTTVTVQNVDPTPTITGGPTTSPEGTEIELDNSVDDPGTDDTFTYAWSVTKDGAPFASGSDSDFEFTPDDNGGYVVTLTVTDDDGGTGSDTKTVTVTNVDPTATLNNDGPVDEGSPATVSFSDQDDPSTADTSARFHYAFSCENGDLSGAVYGNAGATGSTTCTFADDGSFTVKGRIIDKDGGYTETTTTVTVENVVPEVTAASDQLANEGTATSFNLGSFVDPGDDGPWHVTVDWGDSTTDTTFDASPPGALTPQSHTYDDDDDYTVTVTVAEDGLAAPSSSATFTAKIANVPPTATPDFESPVDEGSSFALALTDATDVSGADVAAGFEYAFDCGGGYGSYGSSASTSCSTTDNGSRSVGATIRDKDGGETEYTGTVTVGNVAPTATLANDGPIGEGSSATVSFSDQFDPSSDDVAAGVHYAYACDNGDLGTATYAGSGSSDSTSCPFGDDGTFTVKARVIDKDGGFTELTTDVTVNNLPPSIFAVTNDGPVDEGSSASIDVTASDPAGANDPLDYEFDCDDDATYEVGPQPSSSVSCAFADDGLYDVGVRVSDGDGGTATGSTTVTVDNVVPVVTAPDDQASDEGTSTSFTLGSFSDPGDDDPWHVTVDWDDGTADTTFDELTPGAIAAQSHTYDDNGAYTVTVTVAEDGVSAPSGSATVKVTVGNVAPNATPDFESPVDEGSSVKLELTGASDASNADQTAGFEYAFDCDDGSGYGAFGPSATRSCPTTDNGTRSVKAKLRDKDGGVAEYTGTVTVANVAPSATKSFDTTVPEGTVFSLALTSPDDPSSVDAAAGFTYAFDCGDGSGYGAFGAASTRSCPTNDNATRSVKAKIRDKDGGEREYTGSVNVTNADPTATLGNNGPKGEGSAVTVSFAAQSDPSSADTAAGFHYAFACDNGDLNGATYAGSGSSASTTCTFGDDGTYTVKARIIDKDGGFTQYTTPVTVMNVAPTGNAGGPYTGTWGNAVTFAGSATNPAGANDTLTYAWDFDYNGTFAADQSGVGLTAPTHTYSAPGTYTVKLRVSDEDGGVDSLRTATATIGKRAVTLTYTGAASGVYSDPATVSATLTDNGGGALQDTPLAGKTIAFTIGTQSAAAATATGTGSASTSITLNQPASTPGVSASFTGDESYLSSSDSDPFTIQRETATLAYTGDSLGLAGANLTLQATVTEAADSTRGDLTKIWVKFEISPGTTCGSSATVKYAQVLDTGPTGDGIGTATTVFAGSEGPYCVVMSIVAGTGGGTNGYYAGDQEDAIVTFYENIGRFATGGGWIPDPGASGNGKGNFGFVGKYNKNGSPKGQMVYVFRGTYNGVPAIFRVKSNSLDALGFSGTTHPLSATLQGRASLQVVSAATGAQLFGEGGLSFVARVVDGGKPSSIDGDTFSLTLTGGTYPKSIGATQLGGGNVMIHLK